MACILKITASFYFQYNCIYPYFSEERDELMAKVMTLRESLELKDSTIQRLRETASDGFVSVQPVMLQDDMLASELTQVQYKLNICCLKT